jgi:hypothetical protein
MSSKPKHVGCLSSCKATPSNYIRILENQLSSVLLRAPSSVPQNPRAQRCCYLATGASQDHSAVLVSTMRPGVQFRRPKATSPLQELEVLGAERPKLVVKHIPSDSDYKTSMSVPFHLMENMFEVHSGSPSWSQGMNSVLTIYRQMSNSV